MTLNTRERFVRRSTGDFSHWCPIGVTLPLLLLAAVLMVPRGMSATEFEPDVNTLLLAHFNDTVHRADYALGLAEFAGNGATLTDGYYGQAIDLRRRGLSEDFMDRCEDRNPRFDGWGFHARGNVDVAQGTFECWLRPTDPKRPGPRGSQAFLNADLGRSVKHPTRDHYSSFSLTINTSGLRYVFPTVAGNLFEGARNFRAIDGFARSLSPADWHYFALTWSQGELVIYLDGRPLLTHDMTGQLGLIMLDNPVRYMSMAGPVIDELRISNVVRYAEAFEPAWRDGQRPDYAFTGPPGIERYDAKLMPSPSPTIRSVAGAPKCVEARLGEYALSFDAADGSLIGFRIGDHGAAPIHEGLQLYRGVERVRLPPSTLRAYRVRDGKVRFEQGFGPQLAANHVLTAQTDTLLWRITLTNTGKEEIWLEPLLGIPVPFRDVTELFDGCGRRTTVHVPRHRDEYCLSLPFAAVSGANTFVGVGIDPHLDMSDLVSEWVPRDGGGAVRQGTKLALAPDESFTLRFVVVHGASSFGTLDAVDRYHAQFPRLYRLLPDTSVYSYMPMTQYYASDSHVDMKRVGYAGNFWGHGPGHDKGDEYGTPDWWDNPALYGERAYARYTRRLERMWGTLENLHEYITAYYRRSYDNWYCVRRFHTCPDLTPNYIIKQVWPGHTPNEDPLCFGQYYGPITDWYIVNEYNTPVGLHLRDQARKYCHQTKGYCPGFINDMSHAGSLYRHNDPIAQRTPGRSFSRDLGTFVRKALGRRQRYEDLMGNVNDGNRMTFWSDGGSFSYTLGAFSAGIAIEGAGIYKDLTGPGDYTAAARYLIGEKPFSAMTHLNDDWIAYYLESDMFTPATLRDYYRYCGRQLVLFCIEHGITLDPTSYMFGRQFELETAPIMVESTVLGRKLVPAARVTEPLWVVRAGDALDSLLVIGNTTPREQTTELAIVNRYFGSAPLFTPYYGGTATFRVTEDTTVVADVVVTRRDLAAFKAVGLLRTDSGASGTVRLSGDGVSLILVLDITAQADAELTLTTFRPQYQIEGVTVNGQAVRVLPDEPLALAGPQSRVVAKYRHTALQFSATDWERVELIKGGGANFCLVADTGAEYVVDPANGDKVHAIGFERGTANMLNEFLEQYDSEDGIPGNLAAARFVAEPSPEFDGWAVVLKQDALARCGRVTLDVNRRRILVDGPTQGAMRQAMVVLMRMVDRKYPHVGRFFPFRWRKQHYASGQPVPIEKWCPRKLTQEFFKALPDPTFLAKPILRRDYESLYDGANMDFAGRYTMRCPPFIVEPTFGDSYVYGYSGSGRAFPKEALLRRPAPETIPKTK